MPHLEQQGLMMMMMMMMMYLLASSSVPCPKVKTRAFNESQTAGKLTICEDDFTWFDNVEKSLFSWRSSVQEVLHASKNQYYLPAEKIWSTNIFHCASIISSVCQLFMIVTLVCMCCERTLCFPLQLLVWLPVVSAIRWLPVEWNLCLMFPSDLADLSEKHCLL